MDALEFIRKWRDNDLTERSASQQHFLDLCELLAHPKPVEVDKTGESFTFERGAAKRSGGDGWADVWKKGFFAWEYKGRHKDLDAAYKQLLDYREDLESPPLLVVSDMDRIVVHTNFTSTPTEVHEVRLARLAEPLSMEILDAVFHHPDKLRPGRTIQAITDKAAAHIGELAQIMRARGLDPHEVAHFLDRIVFCLFAEDIDLLPAGLFSGLVDKTRAEPTAFAEALRDLFGAMAGGGRFGADKIACFNGNLFVKGPVLEMTEDEIDRVYEASRLDWGAVDPSIFGTLFERGMDPDKRSQIGAHYTGREDIETLVEPVVMWPLRREWEQTKETVESLLTTGRKGPPQGDDEMLRSAQHDNGGEPGAAEGRHSEERRRPAARRGISSSRPLSKAALAKARDESEHLVRRFHEKLTRLKVLDPACGSGNFLYVTLQKLKDLEKEVIVFAGDKGLGPMMPMVGPWQLYGIEINPYAYDLAQMVVWIGYLQWVKANGFGTPTEPILKPMGGNFENKDAILDVSDPDHPAEPDWPRVDCIVGNPPFLGGQFFRSRLGDEYVEALFRMWDGRVPRGADLCCYWFEKARGHIGNNGSQRAGLLATQGIRGGANRQVLRRIKETGDIFFAEGDRPWVLDGANVHVSMVGFDDGTEERKRLDGQTVTAINTALTAGPDVARAQSLSEDQNVCFRASEKGGDFNIAEETAVGMLRLPNPHGRPNSDVIRPWINGQMALGGRESGWIIDYGVAAERTEAALYEATFSYLLENVRPSRSTNRDKHLRDYWWLHRRNAVEMREATRGLHRFIGTTEVSKHRIFVWLQPPTLPDHQLCVFAREDDYFFGVLHSRLHEVWARAQGTQLRERESGFRYTPTTCFETFPFPWAPGTESQDDPSVKAIAEAARELNELRERWLNPPEWTTTEVLEFPGSVDGPWARYVHDPDERGIGTVRYPRTVPDEPFAAALKKRTLTNLYNEMPTWLKNAHAKLNEAVFAAYAATSGDAAWKPDMSDEEILEKLLALNLQRAAGSS